MPQTNQQAQAPKSDRLLDNWLAGYNMYTDNTEAPREFHSWVAISTIAGALNRKCWVDMGMFRLYPSFYTILVAPPGIATKSTTAAIGMNLLKESGQLPLFQGSVTWQAILDELEEAVKQVHINGSPMEIHALQVYASELGVLFQANDTGMIDMLVDMWDGKDEFTRRTKGAGLLTITRPYINFIGCTTPAWLSSYAENYFVDGGFFSRTMFVYADKKEKLIAYPDSCLSVDLQADLIADLKRIGDMRGEFVLTPEAKAWGTEWYERLYRNPPETLKGEKFQSYVSRRQTHLHKVAMVLSAAENNEMVINKDHMILAECLLELSEEHLSHIHTSIVTSEKLQAYTLVCKLVSSRKQVYKHELFNELSSKITRAEFEEGVSAAVFARKIKTKKDPKLKQTLLIAAG